MSSCYVLFRISPSHCRSITVAELQANPTNDIIPLRFNVVVVRRDAEFSSFTTAPGPKVYRLKLTLADPSGSIKCYVNDPKLDNKLIESKSLLIKNFHINDGIVRISQKTSVYRYFFSQTRNQVNQCIPHFYRNISFVTGNTFC